MIKEEKQQKKKKGRSVQELMEVHSNTREYQRRNAKSFPPRNKAGGK